MSNYRFDRDYPSCSRTYATLCIYHDAADPNEVTRILKLQPDRVTHIGDYLSIGRNATVSGWFLGTKDLCSSKDLREHIACLLTKLYKKQEEMQRLFSLGYEMRISIFWESAHGNGGPILDHELIRRLSEYKIDLHFDIWFANKKL